MQTLPRSWRKIIPLHEQSSSDMQEEYDNSILKQAKEFEGFEKLDEENLADWFQSNAYEPGFQHLTDEAIVTNCVSDDSTGEKDLLNGGNKISHSVALQSVEIMSDHISESGFDYSFQLFVKYVAICDKK